jgi:acetyl esterase/lipase
MRRFVFLAVFISVLISGCELSSNLEDNNVVAGVDFETLFARPTQTEINAVNIDWASREYPAENVIVELSETIFISGQPATLRVVSHTVGGIRHYGAIIAPDGLSTGEAPVVVYAHGGDSGVSIDGEVQLVLSFFADVANDFVYVIPSFRDEPLKYKNITWQSEGPASPWDRDVDDTMALLNVATQLTSVADPSRVAVLGFSRGAGVGMLMDARSEEVDAVLDFFGPTDFFGPFVQDVTREILNGDGRALPGLDYLADAYLIPYQKGEISLEEVRLGFIRRSPVLFASRMNRLQLHHGSADQTVPVSQAESMISAMQDAGKTADEFQAFLYQGGDHNPLTLEGSLDRAKAFLLELRDSN